MEMQAESVFPYVTPSPAERLIQKMIGLMAVGATVILLSVLATGVIPRVIALAAYFVYLLVLGLTVPLVALSFRGGRVIVAPEALVLRHRLGSRRMRWKDVESVDLGEYPLKGSLTTLAFAGIKQPAVAIKLKRGRFGLAVPGTGVLVLYLENAQQFVEDARKHLSAGAAG